MDTSQIHLHCATAGTPILIFFNMLISIFLKSLTSNSNICIIHESPVICLFLFITGYIFFTSFFFFFFFWPHSWHMEAPSQGLNPSHSSNLCHSCSNEGSLTHVPGQGLNTCLCRLSTMSLGKKLGRNLCLLGRALSPEILFHLV